uniref:C-type lectin domain-containing protein n=1 Tax=Heliothis virescens TaxID=7102 RepID=A0A2A4JGL8_HELVI
MFTLYLVCLSYLLFATDSVLSKPQYLFSYEAEGWLKLHTFPATWEQAFVRCHYEGMCTFYHIPLIISSSA